MTLNLSPTSDGFLAPLHAPAQSAPAGFIPLALSPGDDADKTLFCLNDALEVFAVSLDTNGLPHGPMARVGQLPGPPLATVFSRRRLTVMTELGPWTAIAADSSATSWSTPGLPVQFPAVAIIADDAGDFVASVAPRPFSRAYTPGARVSDTDVRRLSDDVIAAYADVCAQARTAGALVAPVLARARVVDSAGVTVHAYPPVLLRSELASDFDATVAFDSQDRQTLSPRTLALRGFRPRIVITDSLNAPQQAMAASLVLDISPQFHPLDFKGTASVGLGREAGKGYVRVFLPGADRGLSPERNIANIATVRRALHRFDTLTYTVAAVANPFAAPLEVPVNVAAPLDASSEADALAAALRATPAVPDGGCLSAPLPFFARHAAAGAGAVLWGDVTSLPLLPHSPLCFASRFVNLPWRAWAQVVMADGSHAVLWQGEGSDYAPVAFSPLLSYPLRGAVSMSVVVEISGREPLFFLVPLSSSPADGISSYLSADLSAPALSAPDEISAPDMPAPSSVRCPEALVAASSASPLVALARSQAAGPVAALALAPAYGSAWDFGRERFYACSPSGVFMVALAKGISDISVSMVSIAPVRSEREVAVAPDAVYILADSRVERLRGTKARVVIFEGILGADAIGYDSSKRQLVVAWSSASRPFERFPVDALPLAASYPEYLPKCKLTDNCGSVMASLVATDPRSAALASAPFSQSPVAFSHFLAQAGEILIAPSDTSAPMLCLSRGQVADTTAIEYVINFTPPRLPRQNSRSSRLSSLDILFPLSSTAIDATFTVCRRFMRHLGAPVLCSFTVKGAVNTHIPLRLAPALPGPLSLILRATVSPDTRLPL